MRKAGLLAALGLCAVAALAGGKFTPLKVKTGFWESTLNQKGSGSIPMTPDMQARLARMTPQQRAMLEAYMKGMSSAAAVPKTITSKGCWTGKDVRTNPLFEDRCTWSELTSTGTELAGKGTCWMDAAKKEKVNVTMHVTVVDSEHVKGTAHVSMGSGGQSFTSDYQLSAKYIGSVCGKNDSNMKLKAVP